LSLVIVMLSVYVCGLVTLLVLGCVTVCARVNHLGM